MDPEDEELLKMFRKLERPEQMLAIMQIYRAATPEEKKYMLEGMDEVLKRKLKQKQNRRMEQLELF